MATVRPIGKGVEKSVVGKVILPFDGSKYLQFNGTGQYAEHAPWTPKGVSFTLGCRYTPAVADIGSLVTLLGDTVLQKDASDNLLFTYTDVAAATQTITLSALTLTAGIEYLIVIESDGNGVSITVGADTTLNAAAIDPSTLIIDSWMASAGATLSAGIIRDIDFQDYSEIQNGAFLQGDASAVYVDAGTHMIQNDSTIEVWLRKWTAFTDNRILFGGNHATNYYCNVSSSGNNLFLWIGGQAISISMPGNGAAPFQGGQDYHLSFLLKDNTLTCSRDGKLIGSFPFTTLYTAPFTLYLFRSETLSTYIDLSMQFKITHNASGDTWEYLLNNITSEGIAPNTGNTGSSFDGTVQNYNASTDLVVIPNNTRHYPVATDGNIQPDTLNSDGPELFVPISLDMGWADNGDGSYDWTAAVATIYMDAGNVLEVGKYYRLRCTSAAITGVVRTGFSGSGFGEYDRRSVIGTGEMDIVIEATGTSLRFFADATSTGTVSGISVKETTSAEIFGFQESMVQSS